jgi:hypothetical protein
MKRIALLTLALAALGSLLYAQDRGSSGAFTRTRPVAEQLSLTGTLELEGGAIVLKSGDQSWHVPGLLRYTGFIEGLKEGAAVTLEGRALRNTGADADSGVLWVSKLTLNGKDYDVGMTGPAVARGFVPRGGFGPGQGRNFGPGRNFGSGQNFGHHRNFGPGRNRPSR